MWGAKVKMPCDMDDDILEDIIKYVTGKLSQYDNEEWEKTGLEVRWLGATSSTNSQVCDDIKAYMDKTWEPHWVVCIGRNFGSYVTHVTKRFTYFYYNEKAVMVYKAT